MCSLIVRTPASNVSRVMVRRGPSGAGRASRLRLRQPALELALEELDLGAGELVERPQVLVGGDARVGDDQDPVLDVIEREHRIEQHEPGIVFGDRRRRRVHGGLRPGVFERRLEDGDAS